MLVRCLSQLGPQPQASRAAGFPARDPTQITTSAGKWDMSLLPSVLHQVSLSGIEPLVFPASSILVELVTELNKEKKASGKNATD